MKASLTLEIIAGWHSVIVNALFLSVCIVNSVFVLLLNNLTCGLCVLPLSQQPSVPSLDLG